METAVRISSAADLDKFVENFEKKYYWNPEKHNKPGSVEVIDRITNVTFYVTKITSNHQIGKPLTNLPKHIKDSKIIISLAKKQHCRPFNDNLYLFRTLCMHMKGILKDFIAKSYFSYYIRLNPFYG